MPNKVVITGFKDSLINENIIIKPEPIPPINRENPIMKDAETSTLMNQVHQVLQTHLVQNLELKAIRLIHQALQAHLVQILELKAIRLLHQNLEKANSEPSNERKIKETGYRLNELTAYRYDLIDVDDDADKAELAKKLNDVITHKNGAIPILNGSFI
nr:hypothetical protein [Mycoplasmopsis bovis]